MIQSWHIFRKDVRHLWPDLALYFVLLIVFAVVAPQLWMGATPPNQLLLAFSTLLMALIPITWFVIIIRLIHDESLVGDQQFWITRPYGWISLLCAKFFFFVIGIALPFIAMQSFLLYHAGLNPLTAAPSLLLTLVYFALIAWLPFTAIAAVTGTLTRAFMSLAVTAVVCGIMPILGGTGGPRMTPPFVFEACAILFGLLLAGILLYQYAVRDTVRSRFALVATSLLMFVFLFCFVQEHFAGPVNLLIRHHYPATADDPLRLAFDSTQLGSGNSIQLGSGNGGRKVKIRSGLILFNLPVRLEGLAPSARLHEPNVSFTIDTPGFHYASPWRPVNITESGIFLFIPEDVFHRVQGADVRMHLTLVAERLLPDTPQVATVANRFSVPNNGSCVLSADEPGSNPVCRYAFHNPSPTKTDGTVTTQSCDNPGASHPGTGSLRSMPVFPVFDPVFEEPIQLRGVVCPGTQLTFLTYHPADNFRLELEIPVLTLYHYTAK